MCVSLLAAEPHEGAYNVMIGPRRCCMRGCSLTLGVLANMYAIPIGMTLCRNLISLTMFRRFCS